MDLKEIIALLDHPDKLKLKVEDLRSKTALPEEVKGFIQLYDSLNGDCNAVKNYLKNTKHEVLSPIKIKSFSILQYAAIFVLLLAVGGFVLYYSSSKNLKQPRSLNATIKQPFVEPGIPIFMGNKQSIDWAPLMYAIKKESTAKAISEWQKIEKIAPENDTVIYFGGVVYFNANQEQKAEKYFKLNRQFQSTYNDRSLYFLAMMDWKRNKFEAARKKFRQLTTSSDLELKKAVKIHLKDIE